MRRVVISFWDDPREADADQEAEGFLADGFSLGALHPKDFRRKHRFSQPGNYSKIVKIRDTFGRIAKDRNVKIVNVVIAWELMNPGLTGAIIGIRNEKEAIEMAGGTQFKLREKEMIAIEESLSSWNSRKTSPT